MGNPERSPGNKESNQGKKPKEGRIRVRSSKGFKHTYVKDLSETGEYLPPKDPVDTESLLKYVREVPRERIGHIGRKSVRGKGYFLPD